MTIYYFKNETLGCFYAAVFVIPVTTAKPYYFALKIEPLNRQINTRNGVVKSGV
jgi:hypothetical protein